MMQGRFQQGCPTDMKCFPEWPNSLLLDWTSDVLHLATVFITEEKCAKAVSFINTTWDHVAPHSQVLYFNNLRHETFWGFLACLNCRIKMSGKHCSSFQFWPKCRSDLLFYHCYCYYHYNYRYSFSLYSWLPTVRGYFTLLQAPVLK